MAGPPFRVSRAVHIEVLWCDQALGMPRGWGVEETQNSHIYVVPVSCNAANNFKSSVRQFIRWDVASIGRSSIFD